MMFIEEEKNLNNGVSNRIGRKQKICEKEAKQDLKEENSKSLKTEAKKVKHLLRFFQLSMIVCI